MAEETVKYTCKPCNLPVELNIENTLHLTTEGDIYAVDLRVVGGAPTRCRECAFRVLMGVLEDEEEEGKMDKKKDKKKGGEKKDENKDEEGAEKRDSEEEKRKKIGVKKEGNVPGEEDSDLIFDMDWEY
jgi:hypothetical protein